MIIAWTSNAPWAATGYGVQTKEIVPRIAADGHNIAIMSNYGINNATIQFDGINVIGSDMDEPGNELTPRQIQEWLGQDLNVPGVAITLYDVWVYTHALWDEFPVLSWVPIDHKGVPDKVMEFLNRTNNPKLVLAMSKFGENELLEAGINRERLFYAPHSFNNRIFKPVGQSMRNDFQIPNDAHLTMINAANKGKNPIRKCFPEMLEAWGNFARKHKDAYLYIHAEAHGAYAGVNIVRIIERLQLPLERIKIVSQFQYRHGIDQELLASLYSMSDVLLMTSRGEGFGIPAIEAQACGVPVIVTNWTAQPELVGSGWKVEGQREWDEYQTGWWKVPSIEGIYDALEDSYAAKGDSKRSTEIHNNAIKFAKSYETGHVYETYWRPILQEVESRIVYENK